MPAGSKTSWRPLARHLVANLWEWSWNLRGVLAQGIEASASIINAIVQPVEQIFGWSLSVVTWPILAVLQVPYLGRGLHWLLALLLSLFWLVVSPLEGILSLAGVLPEKQLRVGFCNLSSSRLDQVALERAIRAAGIILREQANVRLLVAQAHGLVDRSASWANLASGPIWIHQALSEAEIEAGCQARAFTEDLSRRGSMFGRIILGADQFGLWRRLLGIGSPITVLLVDSVDEGRLLGCSLGPLADYVTLCAGDPRCLAHELGHACNLWHLGDSSNLMFHHCGQSELRRWQVALLRMSRHVSYL